MVNDKLLPINLYQDFGIEGVVPFNGKFEHPWFIDSLRHKVMMDYSRKYVHLRALKTGVIFQISLFSRMPRYKNLKAILITSTAEDTAFVFQSDNPSFAYTQHKYLVDGESKPSNTSFTGEVKFGNYVLQQHDTLFQHFKEADIVFTDEHLKLIYHELLKRREYYAAE